MRNLTKPIVGIAATGLLMFGLVGCSMNGTSGDNNTSSPSSSSSSSASSTPKPVAEVANLTGKDTQVTVDPGFLSALTSLKVTPGTVGSATLTDGAFHFPITGGNVKYFDPNSDYRPYVQGEIDHDGSGISLTAGDKKVELTNFVIDPGTSKLYGKVSVNGKVAVEKAYLFKLDGSTLKPLQSNDDGTAVLEGTRVLVSSDAAGLLNDTFGIKDIKPDLLVGIAKITINTK